MEEKEIIYEWEDAINYIKDRCGLSKKDIEKVLQLEEGYMIKIGIIQDDYNVRGDFDMQRNVSPWNIDGQQRAEK